MSIININNDCKFIDCIGHIDIYCSNCRKSEKIKYNKCNYCSKFVLLKTICKGCDNKKFCYEVQKNNIFEKHTTNELKKAIYNQYSINIFKNILSWMYQKSMIEKYYNELTANELYFLKIIIMRIQYTITHQRRNWTKDDYYSHLTTRPSDSEVYQQYGIGYIQDCLNKSEVKDLEGFDKYVSSINNKTINIDSIEHEINSNFHPNTIIKFYTKNGTKHSVLAMVDKTTDFIYAPILI